MLIPYAQLIVYGFWMATHDDFRYVIYDYAFTYLSISALQLHAGVTRSAMSAPWLVGGVLVSFLAAAIQVNGIALYHHFNHNDLYHVIQMGGMYLFYRGARLLKDR
jgi:peptidoglycan/LPS O-acetylase OafA/YrhL